MKLTKKQKDFIQNNLDKLSLKQIAKELNVDIKIVQRYINTIKKDNLQKQGIKPKYHLICCLVIFILTFAVYFNSFHSPLMYDDYSTIVDNYYIKDFKNFHYIFTSYYFSFFGEMTYRPLCTITYFVDYYLYKLNPTGYHITNTLFHTLSAMLIYFLIFTFTKNFLLSLFTSLIFALHPIATEAVNAISFREDLMAMVFLLLSILMFVKMINSSNYKKYFYYALSLFSFTLGIFSKETALITPFIIILYDFIFIGKNIKEILKRKYYYLGFFIILLFYFYLTRFILYNPDPLQKAVYSEVNIIIILLMMSKVFLYYLKNLILPVSLSADYDILFLSSHSIFEPMVLLSLTIIILLFITAIKLYKRNKEISYGIFYFFIALLPVSNIIPLNMLMSDRYLYMPSLGFCIVLSYILIKLLKNKTLLITIFSLILIFYSIFTVKQNKIWQDDISLWGNVLKKFPSSARAYNNRGLAYGTKGLLDKAIEDYNRAIELNPEYAKAYYNRGAAYGEKGLLDKAIEDFNKAIELNPKFAVAYNNRGNTYDNKDEYDKAIEDYNRAIELNQKYPNAYNNRGLVYGKKGLLDKAIEDFNKAIEINPEFAIAYSNRALAYYKKGLKDLAIKDLKEAVILGDEPARKILKEYFNIDY